MAVPPQRRASDRDSVESARRHQRLVAALIVGAAIVVGAGGWWIWRDMGSPLVSDGAPNWSPDSHRIVFSAEKDGQADLFVMNADGTDRTQLTNTKWYEGAPTFSPDGAHIAFESDRDGNSEIYVMDPSGRNVRRLTNDPSTDQAPAWSPDSRRIAFTSDRAEAKRFDVYVMNADGTGVERITTTDMNWEPQFSPDGHDLAIQAGQDVKVINLDTHTVLRLTFDPQTGLSPTWSPDGKRLAFVSGRNGRLELFTMNADGSNQQRLVTLSNASAVDPRWSPDGTHIAFVYVPDNPNKSANARQSYSIYDIDLATLRLNRLSP